MLVRLPDADQLSTQNLLEKILEQTFADKRVQLLVPAGQGGKVMNRLRAKLTRTKKSVIVKGLRLRHFSIRNTIHPWTEQGRRFDSIIIWSERRDQHEVLETLERMVGHAGNL